MARARRRGLVLLAVRAVVFIAGSTASAAAVHGDPVAPLHASVLLRVLADASNATAPPGRGPVVCPLSGSVLANVTRPVLTTACPEACSVTTLCVYYPARARNECDATQRTCIAGSGTQGCAFQCVPGTITATDWRISLFSNASSSGEVRAWGSALPDFALNVTQVGAWVGDANRTKLVRTVSITGDDKSPPFPAATALLNTAAGKDVPRDTGVPFELPATFFANSQGITYLRLQNVKYPAPPPGQDANYTFSKLELLFLRNVQLMTMPLPLAKAPLLQGLDLSMNHIRKVTRWSSTGQLSIYNLSRNDISEIEKGAFPAKLGILDLSHNPVQVVSNGTLPSAMKTLYLNNAMLTVIPEDIARMKMLTTLYLGNNQLGDVPENTVPASLVTLTVHNCSLRSIPSSLKSLTKLTFLDIAENDLSQASNFSNLPSTLETLHLSRCQLQAAPADLQRLTKLTVLTLDENALDRVPVGVQMLSELQTLTLLNNPLVELAPGSLPASLRDLSLSNLTSSAIVSGALPASLVSLSITNSSLEEAPSDIGTMQKLSSLNITGCQLRSFEFTAALPVAQLELSGNQLTRLTVQTPNLVYLNLNENALSEFTLSQTPMLKTLLLAGNNLTAVPASVLNLPKLSRFDISGNPIRNLKLSASQLDFFQKLPVVVFDQEMFATDCETPQRIDLQGYQICDPREESKGGFSVATLVVNVCVGVSLFVLIAAFWRRRKMQQLKQLELDSQYATAEIDHLNQFSGSIWSDQLLLHHRLDASLVEPITLLGSGMFGEVWLASYCNEDVAVKKLKQADRESILLFIDEIKLALTLSHPCVVSGIGVMWTKETDIALVTEFMAGGDLRSFLDGTPPSVVGWPSQMVQIALEITEAIVYLHSFDPVVIHRDLKSRNMLLDSELHAKLSDFGVSRFKLDDMTMTAGVGTVRWIAPEVLAGQRYDESADVYSLGVIMSEIDTREIPFAHAMDDSGTQQLADSAIAGLLISGALHCEWDVSCPPEIRSLGERCTAFDPSQRPSGVEVAFQLRRFLTLTASLS